MKAKKILSIVMAGVLITGGMGFPAMVALAQMRGGPPRDMPMPSLPRAAIEHGRASEVGRPIDPWERGLERAEAAQAERLSRNQRDKAETTAKQYPEDYELDRNGALAIRGEVLASDLPDRALAAAQRAGFSVVRREQVEDLGLTMTVLTHPGWSVTRMVDALRRIAPDVAIEADHLFFPSGTVGSGSVPGMPVRGQHGDWRVGMIDTGAEPVARQARLVQQGFAAGGVVPNDHGTAVAAILARTPASGAVYVADIFGNGRRGGTAELMVRALGWMARQNVPVVNIGMVGPYNGVVASAVSILVRRGFLIVAPVGNDGSSARPLYPASLEGVIAVTGVDARGVLLPEASRVRKVDFASPAILSIRGVAGNMVQMRGTSFASPVVARQLAELLPAPAPRAARAAVETLARSAWQPKKGRSLPGHGVIGMPQPSH